MTFLLKNQLLNWEFRGTDGENIFRVQRVQVFFSAPVLREKQGFVDFKKNYLSYAKENGMIKESKVDFL